MRVDDEGVTVEGVGDSSGVGVRWLKMCVTVEGVEMCGWSVLLRPISPFYSV